MLNCSYDKQHNIPHDMPRPNDSLRNSLHDKCLNYSPYYESLNNSPNYSFDNCPHDIFLNSPQDSFDNNLHDPK